MGDRSIVIIKNGSRMADCAMYTHWNGEDTLTWLREAIPNFAKGDENYSMARLIGYFSAKIKGPYGLGVIENPPSLDRITLLGYSHGGAGVIVYDCETGEITACGGYAEDQLKEEQTVK